MATRIAKLEARRRPPVRVRNNVVEYDAATGEIIGPTPPKGTRVMLVPNFGPDWQAALLAQQARLINEASEPIAEEEGDRHNA